MIQATGRTIVIAAEFWFGATGAGLAHGFRQLGWDVVEVDRRDHGVSGRTLSLRLAGRLLRGHGAVSHNRAVIDAVDMHGANALLVVKGNRLTPETLASVQRRGVTTVNYYPDFHFDFADVDRATFAHYDLFLTTKSFHMEFLSRMLGGDRVRFLHHGYSPLVHRPRLARVLETDYVTDVLYVGNHTADKERWLEALARALPHVRLMIVGGRWRKAAARFAPRATVAADHVLGDRYARLVQCARINLAFHAGPAGREGWQDLVSTRTFELPACGGFMLHIDNAEVRSLFEPGVDCGLFSNEDDMCRQVQHYLSLPEVRREMIANAFRRCVPAYSYDARARAISDHIAGAGPGMTERREHALVS